MIYFKIKGLVASLGATPQWIPAVD